MLKVYLFKYLIAPVYGRSTARLETGATHILDLIPNVNSRFPLNPLAGTSDMCLSPAVILKPYTIQLVQCTYSDPGESTT